MLATRKSTACRCKRLHKALDVKKREVDSSFDEEMFARLNALCRSHAQFARYPQPGEAR